MLQSFFENECFERFLKDYKDKPLYFVNFDSQTEFHFKQIKTNNKFCDKIQDSQVQDLLFDVMSFVMSSKFKDKKLKTQSIISIFDCNQQIESQCNL